MDNPFEYFEAICKRISREQDLQSDSSLLEKAFRTKSLKGEDKMLEDSIYNDHYSDAYQPALKVKYKEVHRVTVEPSNAEYTGTNARAICVKKPPLTLQQLKDQREGYRKLLNSSGSVWNMISSEFYNGIKKSIEEFDEAIATMEAKMKTTP